MPSFAIEIREKNVRVDGKFHVAIRLIHNRKNVLLPTGVYVSKNQIEKDFASLTDARLRRQLDGDILAYEKMLFNGLGTDLSRFSAKDLKNYIDIQRSSTGGGGIDFFGHSNISVKEINVKNLKSFAEYMQNQRTIYRTNKLGVKEEIKKMG